MWNENQIQFAEDPLVRYTDGSLMNGVAGSGVYEEKTDKKLSVYLGHHTSVFMAEVYGIELAVKTCIENNTRNRNIYVVTDNRAAIQALSSNKFTSKMVWNCRKFLNLLSTKQQMIYLVKGLSLELKLLNRFLD